MKLSLSLIAVASMVSVDPTLKVPVTVGVPVGVLLGAIFISDIPYLVINVGALLQFPIEEVHSVFELFFDQSGYASIIISTASFDVCDQSPEGLLAPH